MIEFLPYWIFSIGVPGIILLVILEVAANNHVMKLFVSSSSAIECMHPRILVNNKMCRLLLSEGNHT